MCRQRASSGNAFIIGVTLTIVALSGRIVAQSPQPPGPQPKTLSSQPPAALGERHPRYRVMPSDVLSISFPLSPELNFTPTVQPDGFITVPNAGSLYVQGKTVVEIVEALKVAYAKILHNPIISVDLTNFQAPQFTVNGQVGRPGQYPLRATTTISEAIAIGGGFLPTAKSQVFVLHRVSDEWVSVKKFNVKEILHGKKLNEDVMLQPGDMVFVPSTFISHFREYIPYATGIAVNPATLFPTY